MATRVPASSVPPSVRLLSASLARPSLAMRCTPALVRRVPGVDWSAWFHRSTRSEPLHHLEQHVGDRFDAWHVGIRELFDAGVSLDSDDTDAQRVEMIVGAQHAERSEG